MAVIVLVVIGLAVLAADLPRLVNLFLPEKKETVRSKPRTAYVLMWFGVLFVYSAMVEKGNYEFFGLKKR